MSSSEVFILDWAFFLAGGDWWRTTCLVSTVTRHPSHVLHIVAVSVCQTNHLSVTIYLSLPFTLCSFITVTYKAFLLACMQLTRNASDSSTRAGMMHSIYTS